MKKPILRFVLFIWNTGFCICAKSKEPIGQQWDG